MCKSLESQFMSKISSLKIYVLLRLLVETYHTHVSDMLTISYFGYDSKGCLTLTSALICEDLVLT